ncbi:hypothetical protein BGX33_003615 [Mortierella sp. NVP41]|nr:hypothetical protein BGX33_003615 [Mortierella sp. NVP41]
MSHYSYPPPGGAPNANSPNPLRPYYSASDSPLQSYYNNTLSSATLEDELAAQNEINSQAAAKELASYGLIKYMTLAIAAPFEAGQTLLQVQYLPNDDGFNGDEFDYAEQKRRESNFQRALEEEEHQRNYYNDRTGNAGGYYSSQYTNSYSTELPSDVRARFDRDRDYDSSVPLHTANDPASREPLRLSVYEESTRPEYQMAPVEGGVWKAMTDLAKHPTEGWMSLWKGQYTNWIYEMLHLFAQPTLEATLNDTFDLYDDTIPLVHLDHVGPNIATMVTSHLVVGFLLSPLELVRTRLVVQTANPLQRKYSGMVNCIATVIQEEGLTALWGGVNLFPTLIYHTLTPLMSNSIPLIIDRVFKLSAADSPFLYSLAELGLNTIELLIRLPIETVRKRLQLQIQMEGRTRPIGSKKYRTVVETRKRPYYGMVDCVYRIIKEEGGHHKRVSSTAGAVQQRPWYSAWGVRGLYTGLGMHLTSNVTLFAVGAVTNLQDEGDDCIFQAPSPKKRRLNPTTTWAKYLADSENSKCLSVLAAEFLKVCKSMDSVNEPLAALFQIYHSSLQSPARSALLLALLYNIFHPNSTLPLYDRIKSPISLSKSFIQLTQYLDVSNQFQWTGTMALILRCLQQPDCETIPSETSVAIMTSLLKKINLLPLNCNHDQRECATKGLEVIQAFLEIPSATKTAHATYYDLLREIPQVFPPGVVIHWTLERFMDHLNERRQNLAFLVMPPDASWPLISQINRQHEFTNLTQRPSQLLFAPDYAKSIKDGHMTTYVSLFGDLLYQRAPSDEIFFMIRQLPHTPAGVSALRESLVIKTRDVVRCIQRHSRFHEPRQSDMHPPVTANPEMVIPDNVDFMELLIELSDQLYAFVGSELSQISNIYPTGYSVLYEDLIVDYHALITATDKAPAELEKDNTLIFLLLQLIHIEKVGGKDKLLAQDYAGDEHLFRLLIALYNEDQVNSRDGFYLRDLALQCAISHQQTYIRDRSMMKLRHPKLAVIWPYYSQICYNVQSYFLSKYKNNLQDITCLSNLPTQENVKIAMESQIRQHIVAGTLFIYLVPNYQGKEPELDASGMFLKGGTLSHKLLDMLNIDTKHRLLGLIYKMMLDGEAGPRFHGDPPPQVKFVSPYVIDVVYKLLSSTPCSVEPVIKVLFDKLRRYDRKSMQDVPAETTRWQFTVLQLLNFRLIRPLKFTATCAHLLHYMKFALSGTKHRALHNLVETCNHSALSIQTSHKFLRSLVDNKRERPFWFEESEALARRAVMTIARVVKLRGQGDAPLGIISEILQILHKHPIIWTEEILAFFPEPVRDFYRNQEQSGIANGIPGAVTEQEVSTLLEGTSVHNVLLVAKGTEPNTYLLSHYSDLANHPFFLCVFWEIIIIHQQISETMLEDVRAVMLQFPPSYMSTYTQQLIDYALWKLDPKNPTATDTFDLVVRVFDDLVWKYQLLSIEHVLQALMTGHPARSGDLGLKIVIQMTIHSSELSSRISHWNSLGFNPRAWEEDTYYEKLQSYLVRYPEYFSFEAHEVRTGNTNIVPPVEMPLLVSYNNVLIRLLNIFDMIIGRFIEYQMTDTLITFLEQFGSMYLYHSTPMGFVRDTLLYYYESPTLRDPRVIKALVKLLDFKQVELSPVLTDYIQDANRSEEPFDENYVHEICRKLAVSMEPKECGMKTDSSMPERQYREISNPAAQGLYIAVIETLSAPIPKERFMEHLLSLVLAKRPGSVASAATPSASTGSGSNGNAPASRVVPEARVIHAAGLLLSALPKEFMDLFFVEVDSFTRTDETLLQASTPSAKSSTASRLASATAAYNGAKGMGVSGGAMKSETNGHHDGSALPDPSAGKRTTAQDMLLGSFFSSYAYNRHNYRSNLPNSFLTFFHAVVHYSSADILLRVMKCLENWRRGTCLPPPEGSSLLNYNNKLIRINNQYDSLRDEEIEAHEEEDEEDGGENGVGGAGGISAVKDPNRPKRLVKNKSIRTDTQLLFICALIGPLTHRFEKVQVGGTTGHFFVVLVELFTMVTDMIEVAAAPGLCTLERVIDFIHHVRAHIPKDPDTSARLALLLKGMRPWLQGRLGSIV